MKKVRCTLSERNGKAYSRKDFMHVFPAELRLRREKEVKWGGRLQGLLRSWWREWRIMNWIGDSNDRASTQDQKSAFVAAQPVDVYK